MKKSLLLTLILLSTLFFAAGAFCEKVTVATLNWAPYISENMANQGYVAQIIHKSFASQGYDVELKYWPWARTVAMAEKGKVDAYGPEYYAEKLNEQFHVSEPFQGGPAGLFRLKGSDITYETLEDLKGYRIGVVRGYVNEKEFDNADFLEKDPVKDDLTNIKKLLAGRIDLFFCDKYVGKWVAKQNGYDPDKLEFIKPMVQHPLYLCFPKNRENSKAKVDAFNKGLEQIKSDGTMDKIMNNKGF